MTKYILFTLLFLSTTTVAEVADNINIINYQQNISVSTVVDVSLDNNLNTNLPTDCPGDEGGFIQCVGESMIKPAECGGLEVTDQRTGVMTCVNAQLATPDFLFDLFYRTETLSVGSEIGDVLTTFK